VKKIFILLFVSALFVFNAFSNSSDTKPLTIKGFYLGMDKTEVQKLYQKLKSDHVAEYISIENSEFRDLIQVDNEFSSMGNKIEIGYDENGKVTNIKFQYKTVDILFEASSLEAEDFVNRFREEYNIPEMEFQDLGMIKTWSYSDEARKFSLSIDDYKNITLKAQ
jgi:uncharacterized protein YuzE